jgi:hypothetical protein
LISSDCRRHPQEGAEAASVEQLQLFDRGTSTHPHTRMSLAVRFLFSGQNQNGWSRLTSSTSAAM